MVRRVHKQPGGLSGSWRVGHVQQGVGTAAGYFSQKRPSEALASAEAFG